MLYDAEEIDNSPREWSEVFSEACTIYQIVYGYALQKTPVLQRDVTHGEAAALRVLRKGGGGWRRPRRHAN
jgi:hypothetical protein